MVVDLDPITKPAYSEDADPDAAGNPDTQPTEQSNAGSTAQSGIDTSEVATTDTSEVSTTDTTDTSEVDSEVDPESEVAPESAKIENGAILFSTPGLYRVVLSGTDHSGNESQKTITVTVFDDTKPDLSGLQENYSLPETETTPPDYLEGVTAADEIDGDVKSSLTVDDSAVNYKQPGTYTATLRAQDKAGNTAESALEVIITAGWITKSRKVYYYSPDDGHLYHDWSHIDGKIYYFAPDDGHLLKGSQTIGGRQYLLDQSDGHMITGWQTIDGKKYYFSTDDGHMYHDWSYIGGEEYYFDPDDGHMYTGTHYVDGEEYNFGTSGIAQKVQTRQSSYTLKDISDYAYIGNVNSHVFHHSWCSSVRKMKEYNKVGFDSRSDAINGGYRPCKNCDP